MILVTSLFYWYHAVTLTFDLLQGQIVAKWGTSIPWICLYCLRNKNEIFLIDLFNIDFSLMLNKNTNVTKEKVNNQL